MINRNKWITMCAVAIVLLASCKVTQPYQQSEVLSTGLYRDTTLQDTANMATLSWKSMFPDAALQGLIQEGLNNNLDMQIATSRMKQAQANVRQSKAMLFPSVNANANAVLNKTGEADFTHTYDASLSSSWELDLWGKLRSTKRAYQMVLKQSEAYKQAVQTQLVADITTYYYTLLGYDAKLKITLQTIENCKQDVEVMKQLKESNVVTGAAVVQSEANRYSAEVTIPDLKQSIRETENSLALLLGRNPGGITRTSLDTQKIAVDLKIGVPAQLLANRPDIREAEYALRYYAELTNVARSYFYPSLSITAEVGFSNSNLSQLFNTASVFSNIVGGLTQPIFNHGLNKQRLEVAKAQQEQYLLTFKKTLLTAGQEVSNALFQYQTASDKIALRSQQIAYLEKSVEYTRELLKYTSATNYTDVLTSEQSLLAAQLNSVSDKLQQLQAVVTLYRSLGGGSK